MCYYTRLLQDPRVGPSMSINGGTVASRISTAYTIHELLEYRTPTNNWNNWINNNLRGVVLSCISKFFFLGGASYFGKFNPQVLLTCTPVTFVALILL